MIAMQKFSGPIIIITISGVMERIMNTSVFRELMKIPVPGSLLVMKILAQLTQRENLLTSSAMLRTLF